MVYHPTLAGVGVRLVMNFDLTAIVFIFCHERLLYAAVNWRRRIASCEFQDLRKQMYWCIQT